MKFAGAFRSTPEGYIIHSAGLSSLKISGTAVLLNDARQEGNANLLLSLFDCSPLSMHMIRIHINIRKI